MTKKKQLQKVSQSLGLYCKTGQTGFNTRLNKCCCSCSTDTLILSSVLKSSDGKFSECSMHSGTTVSSLHQIVRWNSNVSLNVNAHNQSPLI